MTQVTKELVNVSVCTATLYRRCCGHAPAEKEETPIISELEQEEGVLQVV